MHKNYRISPSELTFFWDECPRCFYLKYVYGISRPSTAFPSIFGNIDRAMKAYYGGRPTSAIDLLLPPGRIMPGESWVESGLIEIPGFQSSISFRGKYDAVMEFEDGSYGLIDYKTSDPKPEQVPFYSRQLHAYALALENPAPGKFGLTPISVLGLLSLTPRSMDMTGDGQASLFSTPTWQAVPRDDTGFFDFLGQVLTILELPEPPAPGENCGFCKYREGARQYGW